MNINQIKSIKGHRIFHDFTWKSDLYDFAKYNLIFGWNGSGKTTLSNLFHHIEARKSITEGEVQFVIEANSIRGDSLEGNSALPNVRVFNRDFISNNVFSSKSDSIAPIFFLGKESIEKQKIIDALKEQIKKQRAEYAAKKSTQTNSSTDLDAFCQNQARNIKGLLSSSGSNPYNNYDKRTFKTKCESLITKDYSKFILSDDQKNDLKRKKESSPKEALALISINQLDISAMASRVQDIAQKNIVSQVLDNLIGDALLGEWVKNGLTLHSQGKRSHCGFCEQPIPEGRLQRLEEHFNDQYNQFILDVDNHLEAIERCRATLKVSLPHKSALYDHLASDYDANISALNKKIDECLKLIDEMETLLKTRRLKPFEPLSVPASLSPECSSALSRLTEAILAVNEVVSRHNAESTAFSSMIVSARKELEESLVAEVLDMYKSKSTKLAEISSELTSLEDRGKKLAAEIEELEIEIAEHRRPASELNEELASYLGRQEIIFTVKDGGYAISRNGVPANDLSEGERTAVAFLYFLKSLQSKDFNLSSDIVVIDDPVSSLDTNSLFCAIGFLRERARNAGQLFILTHNATLFREIKNWFNHLNKNKKDISKHTARFFMIATSLNGESRRHAAIVALDPLLKKYESDYHYLFYKVYSHASTAEIDPEAPLEQYYSLPNIARRLLETFLAFRYPTQSGNLRQQLEKVEFDPAKKARILRFLHTFSHDGRISDLEHDPSILAETPHVLRNVLDLIKQEDEEHFKEMEAVLSLDSPEDP